MRIFVVIVAAVSVCVVLVFAIFGIEGIEFAQKIAIPKIGTIEVSALKNVDEEKLIWAIDALNKQNQNTEELYKKVINSYRKLFNIILFVLIIEIILLSIFALKNTNNKRRKQRKEGTKKPNQSVQGTADSRRP
jgi:hypothetical protein